MNQTVSDATSAVTSAAPSKTALALDYIARHPGARSAAIAEAAGIAQRNVVNCLTNAVKIGYLVVCEVTSPTNGKAFEYRLSTAGEGMTIAEFKALHPAGAVPNRIYTPERLPRRPTPSHPSAGAPACVPAGAPEPAPVILPAVSATAKALVTAPLPVAPAEDVVRPEVAAFAALATKGAPDATGKNPPAGGRYSFCIFDDGRLAIACPDGRTIDLQPADIRRLRQFLGCFQEAA